MAMLYGGTGCESGVQRVAMATMPYHGLHARWREAGEPSTTRGFPTLLTRIVQECVVSVRGTATGVVACPRRAPAGRAGALAGGPYLVRPSSMFETCAFDSRLSASPYAPISCQLQRPLTVCVCVCVVEPCLGQHGLREFTHPCHVLCLWAFGCTYHKFRSSVNRENMFNTQNEKPFWYMLS